MTEQEYFNELQEKYQRYTNLLSKVDPKERKKLEESLATLKFVLNPPPDTKVTLPTLLCEEYKKLIKGQELWPVCQKMAKLSNLDIPDYTYPEITLRNEELLALTSQFFKNVTPPEVYERFIFLFNQRKTCFLNSNILGFYADSLFLQYDQSFYIRLEKKNEFSDLATLVHEYGHGIQFLTTYNPEFFNELAVFSEIVSIFFELLCTEYYTNDSKLGKLAIISNYDFWDTSCGEAYYVTEELPIIKELSRKCANTSRDIRRKVQSYLKTHNVSKVTDILKIQPANDFIYLIGYAYAIELFLLYQQDHDYAFDILEKIMELDSSDYFNYLEGMKKLGIEPAAHLKDFDAHLKRELTRL